MKGSQPKIGPKWLEERIARGETVLIDGATSTELERRGVPMHDSAWSGAAMLSHGDTLQSVHEDYIKAGAEVIITNTFATSRQVLEPAGFGDQVEKVNRLAVEIAIRARDAAATGDLAIAGSISDFRPEADNEQWTNETTLRATYREQAQALAEAGVDLLAMEMMQEPEIAVPSIECALETGLPVWVGMSCRLVEGRQRLAMHDDVARDFAETLNALVNTGAGVMIVMHSHVPDTSAGLDELRACWDGPMGAYPNSGYFQRPNWQFVDIIPPDEFAVAAKGWADKGAQILGGCCGIGPEHIARLKTELER
ncbi:MAG: homocysteine S-methyltransferase family protein [Gammaproteobacteria bacterium]